MKIGLIRFICVIIEKQFLKGKFGIWVSLALPDFGSYCGRRRTIGFDAEMALESNRALLPANQD